MGSCYAKIAVDYALEQVGNECGKTNQYSAMLDEIDYFNTKKNGYADSCSIFVNACIYMATVDPSQDKWTALYMMYEPQDGSNAAAGCTQAAGYFKSHDAWYTNPKDFERGDQIFFWKSNKAIYHTGIITGWNENGLEVVEGNTNGGMVAKKFYSYDDEKIAGVGRPRYDGWEYPTSSAPAGDKTDWDKVFTDLARRCYRGEFGNGLDRKHAINGLGYGNIFSEVQKRVNLIVAGKLTP